MSHFEQNVQFKSFPFLFFGSFRRRRIENVEKVIAVAVNLMDSQKLLQFVLAFYRKFSPKKIS